MRYLFLSLFFYAALIVYSYAAMAQEPASGTSKAVLAGGCFWCVEHDLEKLDGVIDAVSGYAGGERPDPTYDNYSQTTDEYPTSHIEVVEVTYNPDRLSYGELLDYFLRHIDPTDGGGQFCDRGPQYRPAIFVADDARRAVAKAELAEAAAILDADIAVDILPAAPFWKAEEYHQDYADKNAIRYNIYRWNCGRDARIDEIWPSE